MALLAFAAPWVHAAQGGAMSTAMAPRVAPLAGPLVIEGLGKGTFTLSGPWQFHVGDDPAWANPAFDSSGWEQLTADRPWGKQGHAHLTGFAWYRCAVSFDTALSRASGVQARFSLLVPRIRDAYEIYWNGVLIGRNGKFPPHPVRYISQPAQSFELGLEELGLEELGQVKPGQVQQGVLAVRVWKSPLLSDDSGERGGFDAAPLIGSPEAIATAKAADEYQWLRSRQLHFGANLLCAVIALLSLLLWLRAPSRWVLFWMTGIAIAEPVKLLLLDAHLGWPYSQAMGAVQPLSAVQDISLWFLLLWLLSLHGNRVLCRLTQILACIYMVNGVVDGVMVVIAWNPRWTGLAQNSDSVLTILSTLFEAFPLILVGFALFQRKQFDSARWMVAILVFLDEMMIVFSIAVKQGRQFTGWSIGNKIDAPLFYIDGNGISVSTLAGTLLLAAIVYAVYNSVREDQRRQDALEREKIELLHESNRMRHHAEHDGLTGLWNHRMIVERLGEEMNRSLRDGTPLSVILADVDYFKKVNDSFGHLAGDLVLKEIGVVFMRTLRPYDCVGRYGGEEFLLILPNCEIESALMRGEQLREAVQSARVMDGETMLQVTASFGVASAFPSHYEAETVIRAVDAALYRAKSSGRNCVVQAELDTAVYES